MTTDKTQAALAEELRGNLVDIIREELMSTDYPVSEFEQAFADRILAALTPAAGEGLRALFNGIWQPIETAPKDGTWFVAWENGETYPCEWLVEEYDEGPPREGWFDHFNQSFEDPTYYWMPQAAPEPVGEAGVGHLLMLADNALRNERALPNKADLFPMLVATIRSQAARLDEAEAYIREQIEHVETRIKDGTEMGASVWRIALEDVARENRAFLSQQPEAPEKQS